MNLSKNEVRLVKTISISKAGLHVYTIFRRAGLAAPAMAEALQELQRKKILDVRNEVVALSDKGRKLVAAYPSLLVVSSAKLSNRINQTRGSSRVEEFKGAIIGVNEFYIPKTSELPKSLLRRLAEQAEVG